VSYCLDCRHGSDIKVKLHLLLIEDLRSFPLSSLILLLSLVTFLPFSSHLSPYLLLSFTLSSLICFSVSSPIFLSFSSCLSQYCISSHLSPYLLLSFTLSSLCFSVSSPIFLHFSSYLSRDLLLSYLPFTYNISLFSFPSSSSYHVSLFLLSSFSLSPPIFFPLSYNLSPSPQFIYLSSPIFFLPSFFLFLPLSSPIILSHYPLPLSFLSFSCSPQISSFSHPSFSLPHPIFFLLFY
jgi:hypothetical protein